MKIIADENIPYADELFSMLGEVSLLPGRKVRPEDVNNASILLTRSVTKVNRSLLDGSDIQFVGTCTIGTDHIDLPYLASRNISFSSAPGCNAYGVVQYDICALAHLGKLDRTLKYAVVGCGNVGGRVYRTLKGLGLNCVGVDPHLTTNEIPDLVGFDAIFDCDVICLHTPLVRSGEYPTESLIGTAELARLKPGCVLLNAGRGECIDNMALLEYMKTKNDITLVLDVWANEPHMNPELFTFVDVGTPHIAGYSFEGRVNGSMMIFEALSRHLGKKEDWIKTQILQLKEKIYGPREAIEATSLEALVLGTYDIQQDHNNLAAVLNELPLSFDRLRKTYFKRREFSHYVCGADVVNVDALGMGAS